MAAIDKIDNRKLIDNSFSKESNLLRPGDHTTTESTFRADQAVCKSTV